MPESGVLMGWLPRLRRKAAGPAAHPESGQTLVLLEALRAKVDELPRRDEWTNHIANITQELAALSREVRALRRQQAASLDRLRDPKESRTPGGPAATQAIAAESTVQPATSGRVPPPVPQQADPGEPAQTVEEIILTNFDSVDRDSGRNMAIVGKLFSELLRDRISKIEEIDNAILFFTSPDTAYVHPWSNALLGRTWLPHFTLSRGANQPVLSVHTLAVVRRTSEGWTQLQKGYARNDN